MSLSNAEFIEAIKKMPVLQLSELVQEIEKEFNVSAAAPMMAMAPAAGGAAAAAEEKTEFNVMLTAIGEQKVNVIKAVRELTGLGLKEAKDKVEGAPSAIKEGVSKEEAEKAKKLLTEAGASVEIK